MVYMNKNIQRMVGFVCTGPVWEAIVTLSHFHTGQKKPRTPANICVFNHQSSLFQMTLQEFAVFTGFSFSWVWWNTPPHNHFSESAGVGCMRASTTLSTSLPTIASYSEAWRQQLENKESLQWTAYISADSSVLLCVLTSVVQLEIINQPNYVRKSCS